MSEETRRAIEPQLQESGEYFRLLVDSVTDYAIFLLDPQGYVTSWNAGAARIKGYKAEEIIGRHFSCFYPLEDRENHKPERELARAATAGRVEDEGWRIRKDGARFWASVVMTALYDQQGQLRGFAKVTRDLTERKRVEDQLRILNAALEQRVAERTAKLEDANKDMQQVARIAAHDLQEPLHLVVHYSQFLARRYQGKLDSEADEFIGYVVQGALRMQRLVLDLLTYIEAGTLPLQCAMIDCETLLNGALTDIRGMIADRGATVTHDPLPTIWGDARQLQTVFRNLIHNGIKFHGEQAPVVHISAVRQDNEWVFSVQDNGIGIPAQDRARLFVPFQRLHHQEPYPKPGIGLALCQKILERHGGRIWAESEPDKGATFFFSVPA